MDKIQSEFFKACYLADPRLMQNFEITESLKQFMFSFSPESGFAASTGSTLLQISAEEVLKMTYDAWYDLKDRKELVSDKAINPSLVFANSIKCLELLQVVASVFEVDYHRYYNVAHSIDHDEDWIDGKDTAEFLAQGCRQMDIDLHNAAAKFDLRRVAALMQQGANPLADLYQEGPDSLLLNFLNIDASFYSMHYIGNYRACLTGAVIPDEVHHMIIYLYGAAATEKMIRTISRG